MAHGVNKKLNSDSPFKNRTGSVAETSLDSCSMRGFKDDQSHEGHQPPNPGLHHARSFKKIGLGTNYKTVHEEPFVETVTGGISANKNRSLSKK